MKRRDVAFLFRVLSLYHDREHVIFMNNFLRMFDSNLEVVDRNLKVCPYILNIRPL